MELKHNQVTGKIIDAFFQVYNKMGYGFQEKVYANSMRIALRKMGLSVVTQAEINALTPVKGLLLFNDTEGVLQIYNGSTWKTIISNL